MIEYVTEFRVPYVDVDRMGFFYHSHYLELFDIGRTELMRSLGLSNLEIENMGYELPVCKAEITYKNPAFYDDLLVIKTIVKQLPSVAIVFNYEIYRHETPSSDRIQKEPVCIGSVKLAFMSKETKRAVRPPKFIMDILSPYFRGED